MPTIKIVRHGNYTAHNDEELLHILTNKLGPSNQKPRTADPRLAAKFLAMEKLNVPPSYVSFE